VISRVADRCFWLTRYLERVDTLARLLEENHAFQLDVSLPRAERWRPVVVVVGVEEAFLEHVGPRSVDDGETVQEYLTWNREQPGSLWSSLAFARENARTIRETISEEVWEAVNDLYLWMGGRSARRLYQRDRAAFYDHLCKQCMLIHGICYSTMLHDDPFVFMKLGRALERANQTARILDVKHHGLGDSPGPGETPAEAAQWLSILRSCAAVETFFKRSANVLSGPAVARYLIFDRTFPRSVLHNLDRTRGLLARLRAEEPPGLRRRSWELLERLRGELVQMDIDDVRHVGIHEVLTWIVDSTAELCDAVHDDYLDPPVAMLQRQARQVQRSAGSVQRQSQG
jgi:uncharacterized alpha-E superfamily protein